VRRWWWTLLALSSGLLLVAGGLFWTSTRLPDPLVPPEAGGLLHDVTLVVPGVGRATHRSVAIEGDRIARIAPAIRGGGAYRGAFAFPGLVDAHVHFPALGLADEVPLHAFLYLAHGVTTVRNLGEARGGASGRAKDAIRAGIFAGPRILRCGPFIDGGGSTRPDPIVATTAEQGAAAVDRVVADGFDCVNVGDELTPEVLRSVVRAADEARIPLVGRVPWRVDWSEAELDDAQDLRGVPAPPEDGSPPTAPRVWWRGFSRIDNTRVTERAGEALWQDMAVTPALVAQSQRLMGRDTAAFPSRPELALLPPWDGRALWPPGPGASAIRRVPTDDRERMDRAFEHMRFVVRRFAESGVRVHTGTDSGAPGIVPGEALHEELRLFVAAGLSAEQALAASMVATAEAMEVAGLGRLAPGAPADLVLFARDPTEDLANLDTIVAVVSQGRIYPRAVLDAQLRRYRERYADFGTNVIAPAIARVALRFLPFDRPAGD